MPVTFNTTQIKYKDQQGNYVGINGVAERTTNEQIAEIQAAAEAAKETIPPEIDEVWQTIEDMNDNFVKVSETAPHEQVNRIWVRETPDEVMVPTDAELDNVVESIAPDYEDLTYPVAAGTLCTHNRSLYEAKVDIPSVEAWTSGHWSTKTNIADKLDSLSSAIDESMEMSTQFIDSSKWIGSKYWNNSGVITDGSSDWKAYPEFTVPAGTYYFNMVGGSTFSHLKGVASGTITALYFANSGTVTVNEECYVHLSVFRASDLTNRMFANGIIPSTYQYGVYSVEMPKLKKAENLEITSSQITDFNTSVGNLINDVVRVNRQYIDNTLYDAAGTYWSAAGTKASGGSADYHAYPAFEIPAGTYYIRNGGPLFTWFKGQSNTVTQITTSPFTVSESGTVYFTAHTVSSPSFDYMDSMLANGVLPEEYIYGVYSSKSYIVVDEKGNGDYTNIQDALDVIHDSSSNHITIILLPGTYPRFSMASKKRYISIIGIDNRYCIVKDDKANYNRCAAEIYTEGVIANINFVNTNEHFEGHGTSVHSYAVHNDFGVSKTRYENCRFYSEGGPGVGMGIYQGSDIEFVNCEFICNQTDPDIGTSQLGAFFCHGANTETEQRVTLRNCIVLNKTGANTIALTNAGAYDAHSKVAILIGNCFYGTSGARTNIEGTWDYQYSFGNNVNLQ